MSVEKINYLDGFFITKIKTTMFDHDIILPKSYSMIYCGLEEWWPSVEDGLCCDLNEKAIKNKDFKGKIIVLNFFPNPMNPKRADYIYEISNKYDEESIKSTECLFYEIISRSECIIITFDENHERIIDITVHFSSLNINNAGFDDIFFISYKRVRNLYNKAFEVFHVD